MTPSKGVLKKGVMYQEVRLFMDIDLCPLLKTNPPKIKTQRIMQRNLKAFFLLLSLLWSSWAFAQIGFQPDQPTNKVAHFCFSDQLMDKALQESPHLQGSMDQADQTILNQIAAKNGSSSRSGSANYLIPVVVYVVHNTGPENITDQQVLSQIVALNNAFNGSGISFCLATENNGIPLPGSTANPGIIHQQSYLTNHNVSDEATLKALSSLPSDRYLRIWVVKDISDGVSTGTINGYARQPAMATPALDGIVIRAGVFGELSACGGCTMASGFGEGEILVHEVGHYLNLYHTFHENCSGMTSLDCGLAGDRVCDTPPVALPNSGCPVGANSCSEMPINLPDLINNYMDYTNESCLTSFTAGQEDRMQATISLYRSSLVSAANHSYTGVNCAGGILAVFTNAPTMPCVGNTVQFTASTVAGATYTWDFGDGSTGTGNPVSHTYTSSFQPAYVTLTVDDGTYATSATEALFVENCSPIVSSDGLWYFGSSQGLDFSSGAPLYDPAAFINGSITSITEGVAVQNDASGNLLFFSDGVNVWDRNHQMINTGTSLLGHLSSINGVVIVPDPASPNTYYIFTSYTYAQIANPHYGLRYSKVVVTGTSAAMGSSVNIPIAAPTGYTAGENGALESGEGLAAIAACDGHWLICSGQKNLDRYLLTFKINSSGISFISDFQTGGQGTTTRKGDMVNIQASPNGNRLAASFYSLNSTDRDLWVYDFDKFTGAISAEVLVSSAPKYGLSFSPDSRLLYGNTRQVFQYDVSSANPAASEVQIGLLQGQAGQMQLGPDGKIYINRLSGSTQMSVIHRPDISASPSNSNACFFNNSGPVMLNNTLGFGLPNLIDAKTPSVFSNTFSYQQLSCFAYKFSPDVCATSFLWNFGDPASGSANTSTTSHPTHTFSGPGSYTVTLSMFGSPSLSQTIVVGISAPNISGPLCDVSTGLNNYSVTSAAGIEYSWSVTGGTISGLSNLSVVDVTWTSFPGTVTVVATNPLTGCTATSTETVIEDCGGNPCDDECKIDVLLDLKKKENCTYDFIGGNGGVVCPSQMYTWQVYNVSTGALVATINGQNVSYTFPYSGRFKVCLEIYVLNPDGSKKCKESKCKEIQLECKGCEKECDLEPSMGINDGRGCRREFFGSNLGAVCPSQQYRWTVYHAVSSVLIAVIDGQNVPYTFPGSGKYKVCLEIFVENEDGEIKCSKTDCFEIEVECRECEKECDLKPDFTANSLDGCTYTLVGQNFGRPCYTQIYRWSIFHPNTGVLLATLYGQVVTHTFTVIGDHKVCLEIFVLNPDGTVKCLERECKEVRSRCESLRLSSDAASAAAIQVSHQPNPASLNSPFSLIVESELQENGILSIVDARGVTLVQKQVTTQGNFQMSTEGLVPGMYFYFVEANGKTSNVGKLVVIKGR